MKPSEVIGILIACFVCLALLVAAGFAQTNVPLTVETKDVDYVILDPKLYDKIDELGGKVDWLMIKVDPPEIAVHDAININAASYDELLTVSGIGPVKAGSIVAERGQNGLFADWADFMNRVSGVGPATIADIQASGAIIE